MNVDQSEDTINERIRYLCDILHRGMPLFESCCALLKELNRLIGSRIANLYWYNEQTTTFILFASSSSTLSNYGENQVRLNDFFTGRLLRQNYEPYQVFDQKTGNYKLFLAHPFKVRGVLTGCILTQSITSSADFDYEDYFLGQLTRRFNIELQGLLQVNNPSGQIGYSILDELSFIFDQILNIRHFAKLVVRNTCLVFEAQTSVLSLYNPTMDCFEILDSFSVLDSEILSHILRFDNAVAMKTTTASTLLRKENLMIKLFDQTPSPMTVISVCLRNQATILGALTLYGKKQFSMFEHTDFTLADQELFVHFSDMVAGQLSRYLLT